MRILSTICVLLILITHCKQTVTTPLPAIHEVPSEFVYSIIQHNDSLYCSTQQGAVFRFSPDHPESITTLGKPTVFPLRTLAFTNDNRLLACSYETHLQEVTADSLIPVKHLWRTAWTMCLDRSDNVWLAGRQGVFRESGDTLLRFSSLLEAYDVDFYKGNLAVAHRNGITLYDTSSGAEITTYCKGVICWTIDIFDSVMVAGGVELCAVINGTKCRTFKIPATHTIPWDFAQDKNGIIYLATQQGLYRLLPLANDVECIAFRGKCIKSVFIDTQQRLWVGRYFTPDT